MARERDESHGGWSGRVDAAGRLTLFDPQGSPVRVRGVIVGRAGKDGESIKGDKGDAGPPPAVRVIAEAVMSYFRRFPVKAGKDGDNGLKGDKGDKGPGPTKAEVYAAVQDFLKDHPIPLPKHGRDGDHGKKGERGPGPTDEQIDKAVRGFVLTHPFRVPEDGEDGEDGDIGPMPRHELDPPENPHRLRFEMAPGEWGDWLDLRMLLPKIMPGISLGVASPSQQPGGGGITSVNGDAGPVVVLDAGDVGADPAGAAAAAVTAHEADPNPHPQYLTEPEADTLYDPLGAAAAGDAAHVAAADPHAQYQKESEKGVALGYAPLDASTKVPAAFLPALALTDVFVVGSEVAQLALVAEEGDVAVRTDLTKSFIHNGGVSGTMADWQELLTPTDTVLSVDGRTGIVTLSDLYAPLAHASRHQDGGADEINVAGLSGLLADAQKVTVRKNSGADVGTRKRMNFIEGANITLTVADDAGGDEVDITITAAAGAVAMTSVDVPFTDGDTMRRVTIADAAVGAASKIIGTIIRPDQADEASDKGYLYLWNITRRAVGVFDVVVSCLGWGFDDPVLDPPNETIKFIYTVG